MASKKQKRRNAAVRSAPASAPEQEREKPKPVKWRWRLVIGSLIALSVFILFLSWIKFFDLLSVDRYLQGTLISYVGASDSNPFDDRVSLILIDKTTQSNPPFGAAMPAHRKYHAEMVRALTRAGAKVIVFDVLFITNAAEVDADFAAAIGEAEKAGTKVVVGAFLGPRVFEPPLAGPIKTAIGDHWGIIDGGTRKKSDARYIRLAGEKNNESFNGLDERPVVPSLALEAVRLLNYPNEQTSTWFSPLASQVRVRSGGAGGKLLDSIPVNRDMFLLVDLPGKDEIPHYSYQEVLAHESDYAGNFKDKIVVIGYQENDALPKSESENEPRYGAEIHATAISTLLAGDYIRPLPLWCHYLFIIALVAIAAFLQFRFGEWMDRTQTVPLPFLPPPINKITIPTPIFVVCLIYLLFVALAFKLAHLVFDISYHLSALILTYFLLLFARPKLVRK